MAGQDVDLQPLIENQLELLQAMISPNGAVLASPNGHYKAHWVRDWLYVLSGILYMGLGDLTHGLIRAPFSIFHKHWAKIRDGIRRRPDENYQFLHSRYNPRHFDEFKDEWGHNQLDMVGLFLYLVAHLPAKGIDVYRHGRKYEDKHLLNQITRYLETLEWWSCPDFGMWEEGPKRNSSSTGAVLAGLQGLSNLDDEDLYFNEAQLRKGRKALDELLPDESEGRECDLAQLSLIWPYGILDDAQTATVLGRVEEQLVRDRGVIRYRGDAYYNAADDRWSTTPDSRTGLDLVTYGDEDRKRFPFSNEGSEAEWPLGLAWLAIVYSKLAKRCFQRDEDHAELKEKARFYLERVRSSAVPVPGMALGCIPELYVDGKPNVNTPLTWASAFFLVAAVAYSEIEDRGVPYTVL